MEQMDYNLLFRWFTGLSMDVTVFTKNRDRLLSGDVAAKFLSAVVAQARARKLLSDEHFSVDGTLLDARASMRRGHAPYRAQRTAQRGWHPAA